MYAHPLLLASPARSRQEIAMSIECAFFGFLAADAEQRTSQAGKAWVRMRVGVGKDDAVQWVSVAVFGKAAEGAAGLKKADRVYVEGSIKLDTWRGNDGVDRHGLNVAAFKCEHTHRIGRNKRRRKEEETEAGRPLQLTPDTGTELDDAIPF
jgi:single-stranded DNA-binding protein